MKSQKPSWKLVGEIILVSLFLLVSLFWLRTAQPLKKTFLAQPAGSDGVITQSNCEIRAVKEGEMADKKAGFWGSAGCSPAMLPLIQVKESVINLILDFQALSSNDAAGQSYRADFVGNYLMENPYNEKAFLTFSLPLPGSGGEISDLVLLLDGAEPEGVNYSLDQVSWSGLFLPKQVKSIQVSYQARGVGNYTYTLDKGSRIKKLNFTLKAVGAKGIELIPNCLPATLKSREGEETLFSWDLENLLTAMDIGVKLPARLSLASFAKLLGYAPAFSLLFLFFLLGGTVLTRVEIKPFALLLASLTFVAFYPLFIYLSAYLGVSYAALLSFLILSVMVIGYLKRAVNSQFAYLVGGSGLGLLLGLPVLSVLFSRQAGIVMVFAILAVLALLMKLSLNLSRPGSPASGEVVLSNS